MLLAPWLDRDPETARAVASARAAIERHDWARAEDLIEYAQRRAPNDGTLTFALAELSLLAGKPRAAEIFAFLVEKSGWGEAWRRLAVSLARWGDMAAARRALQRALAENAPPPDTAFAAAAAMIAGDGGWCGLDNAGFVSVPGICAKDMILLDGAKASGKRAAGRGWQLADGWQQAAQLRVLRGGRDVIGSPVDVQRVIRVEGFVAAVAGGIEGWCWLPGEPWRAPRIWANGHELTADLPAGGRNGDFPFAEPRGFAVAAARVAEWGGRVDVIGLHGRRLYGSPLMPAAESASAAVVARALRARFPLEGAPVGDDYAFFSVQADVVGPMAAHPMPDLALRRVLVVVPVYLGRQVTLDCLASVLAARSALEDVLVVVDGSPDRGLVDELREWADAGGFDIDVQTLNRGFPATANLGLRAAAGRDVVLLNNDTLVPPGWIADLRAALYSAGDIGTATALSNAATIFSYPSVDKVNAIPDLERTVALAELARAVNFGVAVDVPTAHGFCVYIRAECLSDTGLLREDVFGQGYGEENDFSLRARHLGWRHVAAAGCFVGHREGVSFGAAKKELTRRNLAVLNRLHPGYDRLIGQWELGEPLLDARRRMDVQRWRQDQANREAVLIITHDRGGGVARHVLERAAEIEAQGLRAVVVRPVEHRVGVSAGDKDVYPNLLFDAEELVEFLRGCAVAWGEIHHFLGHGGGLVERLLAEFPVYDVIVHDYAWYCPRITLTAREDRYCGEPDLRQCAFCVVDHGTNLEEDISPADLHARSLKQLKAARAVIAPSADTAKRYARRFGIKVSIHAWEDETAPLRLRAMTKPVGSVRRVAIVGAISFQKGFDLLLQAARFVALKKLPLEFVVVGFTADDDRLLATGVVRITGFYQEGDAAAVIAAQDADFAFLPAQWPETWSYVLTQIWQAGLPVIALDLGAPAERIRARQGGLVVPAHLPIERLVGAFLDPGLFRG